jgi:hypothetical protein
MKATMRENLFIFDSRFQLSDGPNVMSVCARPIDDLPVYALVGDNRHPGTFSAGYMTSALRASAAKAIAARTLSGVNLGCSDNICSTLSPAASFSRTSSTVILVPAIVGLPIMVFGSEVIIEPGIGAVRP